MIFVRQNCQAKTGPLNRQKYCTELSIECDCIAVLFALLLFFLWPRNQSIRIRFVPCLPYTQRVLSIINAFFGANVIRQVLAVTRVRSKFSDCAELQLPFVSLFAIFRIIPPFPLWLTIDAVLCGLLYQHSRTSTHTHTHGNTHMLFIKPLIFLIVFASICIEAMWFFRLAASSFLFGAFLSLHHNSKLVSRHYIRCDSKRIMHTFILKTIKTERIALCKQNARDGKTRKSSE